jgi:phage tail-like protein
MSVGVRTDPYVGFRFLVQIDSLIVAGFSEVTGLERELETEDYQEGGVNTHTHKLPKRFSAPRLTLKRGLTDSQELWSWIENGVKGRAKRRNGHIFLLRSNGLPGWGWAFEDAYPAKWTGPELRAGDGAVAMESLELVHNGISKMEGLPPGLSDIPRFEQ